MTRFLKISAIVLLVIVDLVAAVLTIRHVNQRPAADGTAIVVPSVTPSTTAAAETKDVDPTGLAITDGFVSRFVKGSCDKPGVARVDVSDDEARTFSEIALPLKKETDANGDSDVAVSSVLSVTVTNLDRLSIIATDADCKARRFTTEDGGRNWTREESIEDWYVENARVVTPDGPVDAQCDVVSLALVSDIDAKVGCKYGEIRGTEDAGETWVGLGGLEGIDATVFVDFSEGLGVATGSECKSRVHKTVSGGAIWIPIACINKDKSATAISGSGRLLGALVGGDTYISTDQGKSWKKP